MARTHGTRARYTNDGCRCAACSIAASEYDRRNGKRRDPYSLPGLDDADHGWMNEGACRSDDVPVRLFFPEKHHPAHLAKALAVCEKCPAHVVDQCLQFALRHRLMGVWGGHSERARRRMKARETAA